jgi:putative transposase
MLKAVKIKLYPNKTQQVYIGKLLGCYRFVYNKCLDKKKSTYINDKSNLGLNKLGNYFHQELTKNEDYNFLTEHNTKVLKQSILNMLDSYKRFFVNGSGFPKFKSKHDNKQTCRFPIDTISVTNNYLFGKITLTKQLKNLKFRCSNKNKNYLTKYKDGIKSATLTKTKSNSYFLSVLVEGNIEKQLPKALNDIVGIDLGIKNFIICSDGKTHDNIKIKRNNQKKLIKLNRQLSKKTNGSKNKNKCRIKLAKFHEKLNNIKENYLHQVTNQLLNENQIIAMENLNVSGMMSNHKLARSIQELSLTHFKSILIYKADWYGRHIVEIDKWFPSSKLCSICGYKNDELRLSDREWTCPICKTHHNRDLNAAKNIEKEGKRILIGCRTAELTLEDYPTKENHEILTDDKAEMPLKSSDRLIQEILNA